VIGPSILLLEARSAAQGRLALWGDLSLADPIFLVLLPLVLLVVWRGRGAPGRVSARVPVLPGLAPPRSLAQRLAWLPPLLEVAALVLVVLTLARPLRGDLSTTTLSEGVDIALVLDRSGSMQAKDLEPDRDRLAVIKDVVGDFARRRMSDREGAADRIGLFSFARHPELLCPFTLDVDAVLGFLGEVQFASREEDGTAIGVALAKAVAVLRQTEAKSKVCVLLTDGENNIDAITPIEAGKLAAEEGVRVYTIFAGRWVHDAFGRRLPASEVVDTADLRAISALTGGLFFFADDRAALERAYGQIEELERTPREERRNVEHFDLYPRLLGPALLLYLLAWIFLGTWARRLP
jgi:Ca-activated chloride channel homolog